MAEWLNAIHVILAQGYRFESSRGIFPHRIDCTTSKLSLGEDLVKKIFGNFFLSEKGLLFCNIGCHNKSLESPWGRILLFPRCGVL